MSSQHLSPGLGRKIYWQAFRSWQEGYPAYKKELADPFTKAEKNSFRPSPTIAFQNGVLHQLKPLPAPIKQRLAGRRVFVCFQNDF